MHSIERGASVGEEEKGIVFLEAAGVRLRDSGRRGRAQAARQGLDAHPRGCSPKNPAAPGTNWIEALTWAAASGIAIAIGRMVAARGAAGFYKKLTGKLPPGLESEGP